MALQLSDIKISVKLPEIPSDLPVYVVHAASLEEREPAIRFFRKLLRLQNVVPLDESDSLCLAGDSGEIDFYRASGSLWLEDFGADAGYADERRPWNVVEVPDKSVPQGNKLGLSEPEAARLGGQARKMFTKAGLMSSEAFFAGVELEQVSEFDAQGKEVGRFVGKACVRFLYRLGGIEVDGPGAKTYAFYNSGRDWPRLSGAYHSWREVKEKREIRLAGIDQILERTVVQDPELRLSRRRIRSIELCQVDLVYLALGPETYQQYVFPALRVDGRVLLEASSQEREGFEFSRFYHAATREDYAASQLYAGYLAEQLA